MYYKFQDGKYISCDPPLYPAEFDCGPSVTDKSSFRPNVDDVRNCLASGVYPNINLSYDGTYEDADKVSNDLPLRNPGLDLAEAGRIHAALSRDVNRALQDAAKSLEESGKLAPANPSPEPAPHPASGTSSTAS